MAAWIWCSVRVSTLEVASSQDQHGRLHQQGPGNGQKLLLAFGYIGSVVDEERIIALGKAFDVGVDPGRLCRGDHLFPGGVGPP